MTQQYAERATAVAPTGARNAHLRDLVRILEDQQNRKLDVVAPASALRLREGNVHVSGVESLITEDGVTDVDGIYRPTAVADEGIADKLRVPLGYLRRMRAERPAPGRERQRVAPAGPRPQVHAPRVPRRQRPRHAARRGRSPRAAVGQLQADRQLRHVAGRPGRDQAVRPPPRGSPDAI